MQDKYLKESITLQPCLTNMPFVSSSQRYKKNSGRGTKFFVCLFMCLFVYVLVVVFVHWGKLRWIAIHNIPIKEVKRLPSQFQRFRLIALPVRGKLTRATKRVPFSLLFYGLSPIHFCFLLLIKMKCSPPWLRC